MKQHVNNCWVIGQDVAGDGFSYGGFGSAMLGKEAIEYDTIGKTGCWVLKGEDRIGLVGVITRIAF